jgi:hypothetical protein
MMAALLRLVVGPEVALAHREPQERLTQEAVVVEVVALILVEHLAQEALALSSLKYLTT